MAQSTGTWRYTVALPLWIIGKDAEGENVAVSYS